MRDITYKQSSLRTATGSGRVYCSSNTILLIENNQIPKGNIFEFARAASFLAAKNTGHILPHCHPVAIDGMEVNFEIEKTAESDGFKSPSILITAEAKSIGRTGIEMEVLTAISVAALTIYDMLKPVDTQLEIGAIKLLDKKGGKTDKKKYFSTPPTCAILLCSTSITDGQRIDNVSAKAIEMLQQFNITSIEFAVVPDDNTIIKKHIEELVSKDIHFIFTIGGTGMGAANHAVDTVKSMIEREAKGICEAMYAHGQQRSSMAMMSRLAAGSIANTMIVTLPGSSEGVRECLEAILPGIFHARKMMKNTAC